MDINIFKNPKYNNILKQALNKQLQPEYQDHNYESADLKVAVDNTKKEEETNDEETN